VSTCLAFLLDVTFNANSKETHPMASPALIFSVKELKALDRKQLAALKKRAVQLVRTSPEIRNIIKKDPKVRKALREKLSPMYNRLKKK